MEPEIKFRFNPGALILILLGILAIAFPFVSTMTVGVITGFVFLLVAFFLVISGAGTFSYNKALGILSIILAIICFIFGWMIILDISVMSIFASFITYLAGFVMIFNGISLIALAGNFRPLTYMGIINILFGIAYIIIAFYLLNPIYLGIVIGIWLILAGILHLYVPEFKEDVIDVEAS